MNYLVLKKFIGKFKIEPLKKFGLMNLVLSDQKLLQLNVEMKVKTN